MICLYCLFPLYCAEQRFIVAGAPVSPLAYVSDEETIVGKRHYSRGYSAVAENGFVHAVIEIPAGSTAKLEVDEDTGNLVWVHSREDGERRGIDYLAYPVNYGMVPQTLADDGDPIDIIVLGRGMERGQVAHTKIIGVLKMGHDGTRDDKLIAVPMDMDWQNGFSNLEDLDELDAEYSAALEILYLWFSNYWGKGATEVIGWGDRDCAQAILETAIDAWK